MTHFLQRTVLILIGTSALSACSSLSDSLTPNFPTRAAEAPATAPMTPVVQERTAPAVAQEAMPTTRPAPAPVESAPLPPPPPVQAPPSGPMAPTPQVEKPNLAPEPRPAPPPPAPVMQTVTKRTVTGKVVDIEGPPVTYEIQKGDSLDKIAKKLGTTVDDLKADNGLKTTTIQPGDTLKGPKTAAKAYVVGQGDTVFSIAKRFSVSVDALREANDLSKAAPIHGGQKLRLPDGFKDKGPVTTTDREAVSSAPAPIAEPVEPPPVPTKASRKRGRIEPAAEPDTKSTPPEAPAMRRAVTGKVITIETKPETYVVKKGDTLDKIAKKFGETAKDLKEDNDLKSTALQPGQKILGPVYAIHAYVAGPGDTLAAIAKRFSITEQDLRDENDLSRRAEARPGQKIHLPEGFKDKGPILVREGEFEAPPKNERNPDAGMPSHPQPYVPSGRPYVPPPVNNGGQPLIAAPTAAPPVSDAQISQMGRGRFQWPLRGDILSEFGVKATGQRNDGVNIQASAGSTVHAAAAGDVVYAGNQVPGFGNLVLIKHADGWVTAYGHLSHIAVKMQQRVAQGEEIGQAGQTGEVTEPQLHFEVRYAPSPLERARPVDPRLVLPK